MTAAPIGVTIPAVFATTSRRPPARRGMAFQRLTNVLRSAAVKIPLPVLLPLVLLSACGRPPAAGSAIGTDGSAIQTKGSDTLLQLAQAWAEAYREVRPEVSIAVTGGGSGTGIAALINGTADIADASRPMKQSEIEQARANGIEPVEHTVAIDALAVIVNLVNPVDRLTIGQLSDIYSGRVTSWSEVGGEDAPIILLSRETNSGTHVYFLEEVVRGGDASRHDIFAPQTLLMPSSVGITSEIRRNPNAIGYDGLGYITTEEKKLAIARSSSGQYVLPAAETAAAGTYPLSRPLFMYTAGQPIGEIAEFLDWVTGAAGQAIVQDLGFVPIQAAPGQPAAQEDGSSDP